MREVLMNDFIKQNKYIRGLLLLSEILIAVIVYLLILFQLDKGTSIDEGYYLQGYLSNQPINWGISQFHYIVRALFGFLPEDNALALRYVRILLHVPVLFLFAHTSHRWLKKNFNVQVNKIIYYLLIFLAGAMSFTFASPVLYYDNMQVLLFLLVFSTLFSISYLPKRIQYVLNVVGGFLLVYAIFNYLPSGILLCGIYVVWSIIQKRSAKYFLYSLLFVLAGFLLGLFCYDIFVHNLKDTFYVLSDSFFQAQSGSTNHNSVSLLVNLLEYFVWLISGFVMFILIGLLCCYVLDKIQNKKLYYLIVSLLLLLFLFVAMQPSLYKMLYSNIYICPLAFYAGCLVYHNKKHSFKLFKTNELLFFLILLVVPISGVFGTNQSLLAKTLLFMPFWIVGFYLLVSRHQSNRNYRLTAVCWIVLLCFGFLHLGYFSRYHYYYTPKRSNVKLENTLRFRNIKVAPHQKEFIENVNSILKENGFQHNDKILAFEVNLITVYAVGGIVPEGLYYADYNMISSKKAPPKEKINYIMMFSGREKDISAYLQKTDWFIPDHYKRIELGKYAENMYENTKTVLYVAN